ncbi:putative Asp-hemolysin precursor [Hygrophoropsis aurantiaca]|uniref:Asp-hemolysin n=1 Tax=Hygrophoropsis aurantiaca TaxID=72124 RepID=A0ACB7ZXE8_9AGAM|nr:putative Asp-hemolysin precursor [Hygrophoropsis aurantiaca]
MAPDAYAQWVVLEITNSLKGPIKIQNAKLIWGKFYQNGNKDVELSPDEIDQIVIPPGETRSVSSCGRSGAPSGTEGSIDLDDDTTKICTLYWNCPWGSPTNDFALQDVNQEYVVTHGPWNQTGGAIGNIAIKVAANE